MKTIENIWENFWQLFAILAILLGLIFGNHFDIKAQNGQGSAGTYREQHKTFEDKPILDTLVLDTAFVPEKGQIKVKGFKEENPKAKLSRGDEANLKFIKTSLTILYTGLVVLALFAIYLFIRRIKGDSLKKGGQK